MRMPTSNRQDREHGLSAASLGIYLGGESSAGLCGRVKGCVVAADWRTIATNVLEPRMYGKFRELCGSSRGHVS